MCWKSAFHGALQLTIACGVTFFGQFAFAQPVTPTLNHFAAGGEVVGRPPELFSYLRDNLFAVIDPLDASVVLVDRNGQIAGKSDPLPFAPVAVRETAANLQFEEAGNGRRAILARSVNPAQIGTLRVETATPAPAAAPASRLARTNARTLRIDLPRGAALSVRALSGGYVADAKLLGRDSGGRWYVQSSEIVEASPEIKTLVFVQRFSPLGVLDGVATVPIAEMDTVPSNIVALTPAGAATAIVPTSTGVFLQSLTFRSGTSLRAPQPAALPARTPISATIHQSSQGPASDGAPVPAATIAPATRAQILSRADAFLNINWTMTQANFSRADIENRCAKAEGKFWQRPRRFSTASIGQSFGPMPYHWGGGDSPESFKAKLAQGSLAGSICTCREPQFNQCQVSQATGVDCSGFVSRTWGVSKHGTSNLHQVATAITNLSQLKPGDALNKAGSHVRLFIGYGSGPSQTFNVIESATDLRCEGVCKSTYGAAEINGYRPMRYLGVQD